MKLFIIRHGDPDYEHDTLTERGWQEAALLRQRLLREDLTKVYLSPLGRAKDTAKPFLEASGMQADIRDFLREFPPVIEEPLSRFGMEDRVSCPWDMDPALFHAKQAIFSDAAHWMEDPLITAHGVGEYARMVQDRFYDLLAENGLIRDGTAFRPDPAFDKETIDRANIAVICHMGLGSLLLATLAQMSPIQFWQMFRTMPTSVSTVLFREIEGGRLQPKIFQVGDTTHLEPIGITYHI